MNEDTLCFLEEIQLGKYKELYEREVVINPTKKMIESETGIFDLKELGIENSLLSSIHMYGLEEINNGSGYLPLRMNEIGYCIVNSEKGLLAIPLQDSKVYRLEWGEMPKSLNVNNDWTYIGEI